MLLDNETGMHSCLDSKTQARRLAPAARGGIPVETRIPASERTSQKLSELLTQGVAEGDARSELIKLAVRKIVEEALEAEVAAAVGRGYYESGAAPREPRLGCTPTARSNPDSVDRHESWSHVAPTGDSIVHRAASWRRGSSTKRATQGAGSGRVPILGAAAGGGDGDKAEGAACWS